MFKGGKKTRSVVQDRIASLLDLIAPADFVVTPNHLKLNNFYVKTFFTFTYPRYLNTNWLSPIINYDATMDISMFICKN